MLDARQLEAFTAVMEQGSFAAAAQHLNLTLAAVSLRVKALEEHLGQRLLVRGKTIRATATGQTLLTHVRQVQSMEQDVLRDLQRGTTENDDWQTLPVAINADSMASWFLPGVAPLLAKHRLLLDITIDDQDHTHDALKSGDVLGCITTLAQAMRGCVAEPLGVMRYRCVATPSLREAMLVEGHMSIHRLLSMPAVIFNRKDGLQDAFLAQHFGLRQASYPRHFVPSVDGFEMAIALGLGWGMVPELHFTPTHPVLNTLVDVLPDEAVDVVLYWQHWARESLSAQRLTAAVKATASVHLRPLI
jgi:LysR family transcriptional regulator (chromosome initiation inhibitor)